MGMARDITERKRWEEMLRRSEEKYRTILENITDGYYEVDPAGNFTFFNDSLCKILGYSKNEMMGMNNRQYMDKENARKVYQAFSKVYATGKPAEGFDWELTRKDGTKRIVEASISLIRNPEGEPIGLRGIVRDITGRKQAEETLRQSEEKYRTILENITDGYYELDLAGNFTFFNDSTCEILGYTRDKMMGMNNRQYMDKENARKVYKVFNRVYTTGKPAEGFDWKLTRKDGTKRFIEASVSLVRDAQGKPIGFRGVVRDVTERRQAEEELRKSEEKYRQLTEEINDAIYTLDKDGTVTYVSPVIEWLSGYSPSEIMGRSFAQFLHEEGLLHIIEDYGHTLAGHSTEGEYQFRTKSGEIRWAGISNRPIFAGDRVVGARGTLTDITKRKLAEQASEEARTRFEDLFENANELIITTDAEGWILHANKEVEKLSGYSKKELIGQSILKIAHPEDTPKYIQFWKDILSGLNPHYELRAISAKKPDDFKYLLASGSAIAKDGKIVEIQYNAKDITEEKQSQEKLRRSEEKYRTILENITDGYYEIDLAGNFTFFNDSYCRMLGYSRKEMIGMNNRQYMDKENARKVYQAFNKVYTTGKSTVGIDWEVIRKDGTKGFIEASASLIRDARGEPIGFRGVARDITERKQMEAERNELEKKAQLATRLGVIGEMASGIVHEINNPLTSVIGFTEMLAQKELPEDAKEYVRIINSEGKRVAGIASRLLNFSRHQNPGRVYTDINKLIEATIELQQYEMTSGNIKITAKLDPHLPRTMADPGQMQQVFLNILLNARTAMRLAHGGGKLLIKTEAMDNTIQISFKDDGPGIAKKNLQRIFYPFFTTRKSGEGTGLGLSICQNIIATHDGTIYARSKLGKGATFIIKLPVVARQRKTAGNGGANHINGNPWR
jgi:PAS domain S-box-containing protein